MIASRWYAICSAMNIVLSERDMERKQLPPKPDRDESIHSMRHAHDNISHATSLVRSNSKFEIRIHCVYLWAPYYYYLLHCFDLNLDLHKFPFFICLGIHIQPINWNAQTETGECALCYAMLETGLSGRRTYTYIDIHKDSA